MGRGAKGPQEMRFSGAGLSMEEEDARLRGRATLAARHLREQIGERVKALLERL